MIQRFLLAAVSCLLIEFAASAAAGLFAPGTEPLLMIGCALGLLLAASWNGRTALLGATAVALALAWGAIAAHVWTQSSLSTSSAFFVHQTPAAQIDGNAMFVLAAACTALAALSGWMLFQAREPWPVAALVGSCLLLRADVSFDYAERFPLFAFGILCLVAISLAGRSRVLPRVGLAAVLAGLAVVVAWQLPTSIPAWSQSFVDPIRSLASRTVPLAGQTVLPLTGPFHPSNKQVMSISLSKSVAHPYWWSGIFDRYDGQSWQMSSYQIRHVPASDQVGPLPPPGSQAIAAAVVRLSEQKSQLFFPGSPATSSLSSLVLSRSGDGEPLQVLTSRPLQPGMTYTSTGSVSAPMVGSAGSVPIPDGAYLQLPSVPSRVKHLAHDVAGRGSTLDRVTRIEQYLTSGRFHYSTAATGQPGRDAVDYFLFDSREGYCNHFATAMAVMLREIGIPSRLVTGYVSGAFEDGRYVVRGKDAHSWVEAYLPLRGWVDFEPTPGFSLDAQMTLRGAAPGQTNPQTGKQPVPPPPSHAPKPRPVVPVPAPASVHPHRQTAGSFPWPLIGLALIIAVVALVIARRPRSARALYVRMARSPLSSRRPRPSETPSEFAERLHQNSASRGHARVITDLYVKERYGGVPSARTDLAAARQAWRSLRLRRLVPWARS